MSGTNLVGYARDVVAKVQNYKSLVLSKGDCDKIYKNLTKANIQYKEAGKLHNGEVKEVIYDKNISD